MPLKALRLPTQAASCLAAAAEGCQTPLDLPRPQTALANVAAPALPAAADRPSCRHRALHPHLSRLPQAAAIRQVPVLQRRRASVKGG